MPANRIKKLVDYLPFVALVIYSSWEWISNYEDGIIIKWQTYLGMVMLMIAVFAFIRWHRIAVLLIGLISLLGLCGIVSLSPAISTGSVGFNEVSIPVANPLFILFLIIHFSCSLRHYTGILTRRYWINFNKVGDE